MRTPRVLLEFILESMDLIQDSVKQTTYEPFYNDIPKQDAVIRRIEIIGKAVKDLLKISPEFKDKYPDIPWRQIAKMREILAHDYLGIDLTTVWYTATLEIPVFRQRIMEILNEI